MNERKATTRPPERRGIPKSQIRAERRLRAQRKKKVRQSIIVSGSPAVLRILPFFIPSTTPSAANQNCSLFSTLHRTKRLFGPFPIFADIDAYGNFVIYSLVSGGEGWS